MKAPALNFLPTAPGKREQRSMCCPKCNPKLDDGDIVEGPADSLKYLIYKAFKCRRCRSELEMSTPSPSPLNTIEGEKE